MRALWYHLVSQGNKHKQISDRLRDAQSKRQIQKAEVDLINQKRDVRITEISTLQIQFEVRENALTSAVSHLVCKLSPEKGVYVCVPLLFPQEWQRKLSQLVPEQQRLTEKLRNISLNKLSSGWQMAACPAHRRTIIHRILSFVSDIWLLPCSGQFEHTDQECDRERCELPEAEGPAWHSGERNNR